MKLINFIRDIIFLSKFKNNKNLLLVFCISILLSIISIILIKNPLLITIEIITFFILFIFFLRAYRKFAQENLNNVIKYTELKAVIQNIEDGIIVYDTNFKIVDLNSSAEKIFNLKKEEIIGKQITPQSIKIPELRVLTQTIFPSLAPSINTISDNDWPKIVEINFDEPHLKLKTILNRVVDESGKVIAFIKIIIDKTREEDILQSKSEFLTVSAHQLRTPLTALNWTLESLKTTLSTEKNKDAVDLANEAWKLIQRSLKIIEDLLNAAKIEEGRFGFNFKETNLADIVAKIKEDVSSLSKELGIKVNLEIKTTNTKIVADEEKLTMAIINIVENAIKYNTPGGSVSILLENYLPDPKYIKLSISDTGIGIPKESLSKMFQKFYRAENAQRVEPNGNGLGLYITKNIIEKHKGKIFVESELQRGSTFWMILPKAETKIIS